VVVRDRETMVLGGLIRDNVTTSEDKVPFLGDIPLLGWLFKFKSTKVEKVNLMLFITPYIIKNEADAQDITRRKADALEKFRDQYHIEKKDVGGLIESKKPDSAPTGTASVAPAAAKPIKTEGKAAEKKEAVNNGAEKKAIVTPPVTEQPVAIEGASPTSPGAADTKKAEPVATSAAPDTADKPAAPAENTPAPAEGAR